MNRRNLLVSLFAGLFGLLLPKKANTKLPKYIVGTGPTWKAKPIYSDKGERIGTKTTVRRAKFVRVGDDWAFDGLE